MNRHTFFYWYRILRMHYGRTRFESVRYALWLAR
jgi:hypothetical protein